MSVKILLIAREAAFYQSAKRCFVMGQTVAAEARDVNILGPDNGNGLSKRQRLGRHLHAAQPRGQLGNRVAPGTVMQRDEAQ